jgi:hypothetical protein
LPFLFDEAPLPGCAPNRAIPVFKAWVQAGLAVLFPSVSAVSLTPPHTFNEPLGEFYRLGGILETLFFYPRLDSVSVQNGTRGWSELLIPYIGGCDSLAREGSKETSPIVHPEALSRAFFLLRPLVNFEQTKHVGGNMLYGTAG